VRGSVWALLVATGRCCATDIPLLCYIHCQRIAGVLVPGVEQKLLFLFCPACELGVLAQISWGEDTVAHPTSRIWPDMAHVCVCVAWTAHTSASNSQEQTDPAPDPHMGCAHASISTPKRCCWRQHQSRSHSRRKQAEPVVDSSLAPCTSGPGGSSDGRGPLQCVVPGRRSGPRWPHQRRRGGDVLPAQRPLPVHAVPGRPACQRAA